MKKYDYLIVGAGLFGATFAHLATKKGKKCLVIDKREHIGGNIYTQNVDGINVHKYGAHIFHTDDEEIWQFVNEFADFNDFVNTPMANFNGEMYNLPFNMNTFEKMWGVKTKEQAKEIIDKQKNIIKGEPKNLEEQAISLVGTDIYKKLVKGYTEKQWGRQCRDLPAFIIKRIPVRFEYNNNYFNDKYQGIPIGGYTKMIEKMLSDCDILLETDYFKQKEELDSLAKKVLYTGAVDRYFDYAFGHLEYRSLEFENELVDKEYYQEVAVVNYTDSQTKFTRIIEHKHFDSATSPKTIITREYPKDFCDGCEPYYPVNDEKNQRLYEKYLSLCQNEKNVIFGGRLGQYKYFDMDDTVGAAMALAKKEL